MHPVAHALDFNTTDRRVASFHAIEFRARQLGAQFSPRTTRIEAFSAIPTCSSATWPRPLLDDLAEIAAMLNDQVARIIFVNFHVLQKWL